MLVLLDRDWGGVEADPPRQKFSVTSVGVIFNQWGVKHPNPLQIEHWLWGVKRSKIKVTGGNDPKTG